jgi:hypothetical protein
MLEDKGATLGCDHGKCREMAMGWAEMHLPAIMIGGW